MKRGVAPHGSHTQSPWNGRTRETVKVATASPQATKPSGSRLADLAGAGFMEGSPLVKFRPRAIPDSRKSCEVR